MYRMTMSMSTENNNNNNKHYYSLPLMYMMDHRYRHFDIVFAAVELAEYQILKRQILAYRRLLYADVWCNEFESQNGQLLRVKMNV